MEKVTLIFRKIPAKISDVIASGFFGRSTFACPSGRREGGALECCFCPGFANERTVESKVTPLRAGDIPGAGTGIGGMMGSLLMIACFLQGSALFASSPPPAPETTGDPREVRYIITSEASPPPADTLDVYDVPFRFVPVQGAATIFLTGDFNGWSRSADRMEGPDDDGAFHLVIRLAPGEYRYGFVADHVPVGGGERLVVDQRFPRGVNRPGDGRIDGAALSLRPDGTSVSRFSADSVSVTTRVHRSDVEEVSLLFRHGGGDDLFPMRLTGDDGVFAYYRAEIAAPLATIGRVGIRLDDRGTPMFLTKEGVAEEAPFTKLLPVGPATAPLVEFPTWAIEGIEYHIVPDRFRDGNKKNNRLGGDGRHGGDLEGVLEKLSSIADLGVTVLSFSPVQDSPSAERFDGGNWRRVGSGIGGDDAFRIVVDEAHNRGMKVVVTAVLHSISVEHRAWIDALAKGRASEYAGWFEWKKWPLPAKFSAGDPPSNYYECVDDNGRRPWVSYDLSLPRREELDAGKEHVEEWNRSLLSELDSTLAFYLVDMDVDGLIIDRPELLAPGLLPMIREKCERLRPGAYVVFDRRAPPAPPDGGGAPYAMIRRREFLEPVATFLRPGGGDALRFDRECARRRGLTPRTREEASINLISSAEDGRFLRPDTDPRRLLLAHTLLLTSRGIPRIHFGDEIGLAADEDDPHPPFPWKSVDKPAHLAFRDHLKRLIALRRNHAALVRGEEETLLDRDGMLVKARFTAGDAIVVAVNAGEEEAFIEIDGASLPFPATDPVELLGSASLERDGTRPGWFTVRLDALSATVLSFSGRR